MVGDEFTYPDLDVSLSNLKEHVDFLTTIRPYRNYMNVQSLNTVATYIMECFNKCGLKTERQSFEADGNTYTNVIGSLGIDRPVRVIVGAHYDVCDDQPGADDNASAVAGLLEIVRLTCEYAARLNFRVDFVAYTLEEPPFLGTQQMGSYVHARSLDDEDINVRGTICLEMIGFFTTEEKSQEYPFEAMKLIYPDKGNFIAVVGNFESSRLVKEVETHMKAASIDVRSLKAPSWIPGVGFSDHRNYWKFGYNAVMITDTAFYRNPNYHEDTDTVDTLDFGKMKEVVKGVVWTLMNMK